MRPTRRQALASLGCWPLLARADDLDATLARVQQAWQPRLAWRPGPEWRRDALATARRLMLRPGDDGSAFATDITAEQARDGHTALTLTLRGSLGDRVPALYLRPQGPGPHPAVLLLHDHGARFDIGKEKLVRPLTPSAAADA